MTRLISGRTQVIAHLGVPTEGFVAPKIYNPYFAEHGIDVAVVPFGCEPADLAAFLPLLFRQRNVIGAIITMPHKIPVVGLADRVSTTVAVCGAANAVRRGADGGLEADMFDGEGFVRGVLRHHRPVTGASALVVGTGGVGSAIAASLAAAQAGRLGLCDTRTEAAQALSNRLAHHYPDLSVSVVPPDPAGYDIVVNATPLGMTPGDPPSLDVSRLDARQLVGEVVMHRDDTALLAAARARGSAVQVGTDMLFEQIPAYLDYFGLPSTTPAELRRLARLDG